MSLIFRDVIIGYQNALQAFLASIVVAFGLFLYFIGCLDIDALSNVNLAVPLAYVSSVLISLIYIRDLDRRNISMILKTYWAFNRLLFPTLACIILCTKVLDFDVSGFSIIPISAIITVALILVPVKIITSKK